MKVEDLYEGLKVKKSAINDLLKAIQQRVGTTENWEEVVLNNTSTDYTLKVLYHEYKRQKKELDGCLEQEVKDVVLPKTPYFNSTESEMKMEG